MKKTFQLFLVAILAGAVTLGGYKFLENKDTVIFETSSSGDTEYIPANLSRIAAESTTDFTEAAELTVNAVVHVKNITISRQPTNIFEYFRGGGQPRAKIGRAHV